MATEHKTTVAEIISHARPLLHAPAMERIAKGKSAGWENLFNQLAKEARECCAGVASATISFIEDGEEVQAEFVPEITITVRTPIDK